MTTTILRRIDLWLCRPYTFYIFKYVHCFILLLCSQLTESQTNYKMLSVTMEALQERLSHEETQHKQLEQRFSILADNHEEMIRIKDEYKRANSDLQAKYGAHLSKECEKCISLENELTETRKAFSENEKMCATLTSDSSKFQSTILLLEKQLEAIKKATEEHKEHLTGRINGSFCTPSSPPTKCPLSVI